MPRTAFPTAPFNPAAGHKPLMEVDTFEIREHGEDYSDEDILQALGGNPLHNATWAIQALDEGGELLSISIRHRGIYAGPGPAEPYVLGSESEERSAQLTVTYRPRTPPA